MLILSSIALIISVIAFVFECYVDKKIRKTDEEIVEKTNMMLAMKKEYDAIQKDLKNWALTIEERSDCVSGAWCMGCQYCKAISVRDELGRFTKYICGKGICKNYKEVQK